MCYCVNLTSLKTPKLSQKATCCVHESIEKCKHLGKLWQIQSSDESIDELTKGTETSPPDFIKKVEETESVSRPTHPSS